MKNEFPDMPGAAPQPSASTGPRTPAGKAASSQNARKHDLCSRTLRLSPEEWAEYNDMRDRYGRNRQPANDVEQNLVDEICFSYWRLQQAREIEINVIAGHPAELPIIALYIRYRTSYERGFYKALDKLQQTQRLRNQQTGPQDASMAAAPVNAPVPLAAVPLAPVPLAAVPLAAVRSAKSAGQPDAPHTNPKPGISAPPSASSPVRSENSVPAKSEQLQESINDHLLENRVRAELLLPPLPLPKSLKKQVDEFVSQNPTLSHKQLNDLVRKAA